MEVGKRKEEGCSIDLCAQGVDKLVSRLGQFLYYYYITPLPRSDLYLIAAYFYYLIAAYFYYLIAAYFYLTASSLNPETLDSFFLGA